MFPPALTSPTLMTHMRALCKEIGPRQAGSVQEKRAAAYVRQALEKLGVKEITEQAFKSQSSMGWITIPLGLIETFAALLGMFAGQWGAVAGGLLLLLGAVSMYRFTRARPMPWARWIARSDSQNVIATIPAAQAPQRRIYLVGHLDSNKQRLTSPPPQPAGMKPLVTWMIAMLLVVGVFFLVSVSLPAEILWLRTLLGAILVLSGLGMLPMAIWEETQPVIEGANDNATAVSVLLGIAEALQTQPLQHSEVVLLFTGCEEVVCVGMEAYLRQHRPDPHTTCWIDLEMVGTGNLCYVTRHGIGYLSQYAPSPRMLAWAAQTAARHPELKVSGKEMLILEEVSNLRDWGQEALCIAGYDAAGYLPNWHRTSDNLEHIEPETLARAAHYTWALMQTIDA